MSPCFFFLILLPKVPDYPGEKKQEGRGTWNKNFLSSQKPKDKHTIDRGLISRYIFLIHAKGIIKKGLLHIRKMRKIGTGILPEEETQTIII